MGTPTLSSHSSYWSNPKKGWRRNLDICAVFACGAYQALVLAPVSAHGVSYAVTVCMGVVCYVFANSVDDPNIRSWSHVGVHFMGNVGNVILYSGL